MKKILLFLSLLLVFPGVSLARSPEQINDWYIKNYRTQIKVNEDSSLLITESIVADCGNLSGKHGIFRTVPYEIKLDTGKTLKTPVKLISITDFSGKKIPYSESRSSSDKTVTWKIGDPDKTVTGENNYRITYEVQNAIRFQSNFEEFYWNLSGNFWELEIDSFQADVVFPESINENNTQMSYYVGSIGSRGQQGAGFSWRDSVLSFDSQKVFLPGEGLTVSVSLPQGTFIPHEFSFWERYPFVISLIIFAVVFVICFLVWKKYGKDPKVDKTIIPEFEIPDNLSPGELSLVEESGNFKKEVITASLINLAVLGAIKIEEVEEKILFIKKKDYKIVLIDGEKLSKASNLEKFILEKILNGAKEKKISELKNKFQTEFREIKKEGMKEISSMGYVMKSGATLRSVFLIIGIIIFAVALSSLSDHPYFGMGTVFSAITVIIFGVLMSKRTPKGAELNWKIQGFRLYMKTAEKHRQQFNEKENIFEKFLPYAIVFGMTKIWIEKMKEIYGAEYFNGYHPIWYAGALTNGNFDVDSFTNSMESVSSAISSNVSSSSGSGGGGFSGGGGGGGGGGGW